MQKEWNERKRKKNELENKFVVFSTVHEDPAKRERIQADAHISVYKRKILILISCEFMVF